MCLKKDTKPAPWQQGKKLISPHQQNLRTTGRATRKCELLRKRWLDNCFLKKASAFVFEEYLLWKRDFNYIFTASKTLETFLKNKPTSFI